MRETEGPKSGDKIRIKVGAYTGQRGLLCHEQEGLLSVELQDGATVSVRLEDVTNYSLAARKAWKAMPKRAGRPQSKGPRKKMVSMRLDEDLWRDLGKAVALGLIASREQAVTTWLREQLDVLFKDWSPENERKNVGKWTVPGGSSEGGLDG